MNTIRKHKILPGAIKVLVNDNPETKEFELVITKKFDSAGLEFIRDKIGDTKFNESLSKYFAEVIFNELVGISKGVSQ